MSNDEKYMFLALEEAKLAYLEGEVPVGTIIVRAGKVIAAAHNLKMKNNCVTSHAEILAIEQASRNLKNWRLNDCIIYVTMFPCPMCASAINQARFDKIVYGTMPDYAELETVDNILKDKNYGSSVEIVGDVLEHNCAKLLKDFFLEKR